jgi:hypothetical protein
MTEKKKDDSLSEEDFLEISANEPQLRDVTPADVKHPVENEVESRSETAPDSLPVTKHDDEHSMNQENEEIEPQPSSAVSDSYFEDDEEFLRGDDLVVHEAADIALFKQDENVVSWEIVNFYKDGNTPRGKMALRNDPPVMKISSSSGDTAEFLVTKEFSKSLGSILQDVNKAYYGVSPSKKSEKITQTGVKNKLRSLGQWALDNKLKAAVAVVVAALLVTALLT